jgi:hypothetical protein
MAATGVVWHSPVTATEGAAVAMQQAARVARGDVVEVSARRVGGHGRTGEVLGVLGGKSHPHYRVRWEDGHESVLYPHEGVTFRRTRT